MGVPRAGGASGTSLSFSSGMARGHDLAVAVLPAAPTPPSFPHSQSGAFEDIPSLFRTILALVADAERVGFRAEAERARREAIQAYGRGWDDVSRQRLERIAERISRRLAPQAPRRFFRLG